MRNKLEILVITSIVFALCVRGMEEAPNLEGAERRLRFIELKYLLETKGSESPFLCIGNLKRNSESKIVLAHDLVEVEIVKFPSRWSDEEIAEFAKKQIAVVGRFVIRRGDKDSISLEMEELYPRDTILDNRNKDDDGASQGWHELSFLSLESVGYSEAGDDVLMVGEIRKSKDEALHWVERYGLPKYEMKLPFALSPDLQKSKKSTKGSGAAIFYVEFMSSKTFKSDLGDYEVRTPRLVLKDFYPWEKGE